MTPTSFGEDIARVVRSWGRASVNPRAKTATLSTDLAQPKQAVAPSGA
jgi:hypothetical protein